MRVQELPEDVMAYKYRGMERCDCGRYVRDFQLNNILMDKQPTILMLYTNREDLHPRNVLVEVKGDPFAARKEVAAVFEKLTGLEFTGRFIDEQIELSFADQERTLEDRFDLCSDCYPDLFIGIAGDVDLFYPAAFFGDSGT